VTLLRGKQAKRQVIDTFYYLEQGKKCLVLGSTFKRYTQIESKHVAWQITDKYRQIK
jgi:hypothetical protein